MSAGIIALNGHSQAELGAWLREYERWEEWHSNLQIWTVPIVGKTFDFYNRAQKLGFPVKQLAYFIWALVFRYGWWRSGCR